ncbi:MAG: hypothetical protein KFW07_00400 [Mycoplasmataceae bacterium]|nr:hypothetical protein [Mycoplasmataceae bacterium]
MDKSKEYYILNEIILRFDENSESHFAGILWTNVLANIVALFIIFSSTLTVTYLIFNTIFKLRIRGEIRILLKRDFLIPNLDSLTFFGLIDRIEIINEEELKKMLMKKFSSSSLDKPNMIENHMSLYRSVFTNYKTMISLLKWNRAVSILKGFEKDKFQKISNLNIASKDKKLIFVFDYNDKQYKKIVENKKLINLN